MDFIDTNIFVRIITFDNAEQVKIVEKYFRAMALKENNGFTSEAVVAEVLYVCTSRIYELDKEEVCARLISLLTIENLIMDHKQVVISALEKYAERNLDFVDCLSLSYKDQGIVGQIFSFDKKLN
ncbi:MAG: PIN domain-containing protein [bacterium]